MGGLGDLSDRAVLFTPEYIKGSIEAILFASGEALEASRLARVIGVSEDEVWLCVDELVTEYGGKRGFELIRLEGKVQLRTNHIYYGAIKTLMNLPEKKTLTGVLLETLAIVAFLQPVTKSQIEDIRGLSADHAVNRLLELGLITESGRLDAPGRPVIFGTTEEFLKRFGVEKLEDLKQDFGQAEDKTKT